jgi:hypothetical protein
MYRNISSKTKVLASDLNTFRISYNMRHLRIYHLISNSSWCIRIRARKNRQLISLQSPRVWPEFVPNYLNKRHVPEVNNLAAVGAINSAGMHLGTANTSVQLITSHNLTLRGRNFGDPDSERLTRNRRASVWSTCLEFEFSLCVGYCAASSLSCSPHYVAFI